MCTLSLSTSLRTLVMAVAGLPAVSSTISSTLRPPIWLPASPRYISNPFCMSRPIWAAPPVSGARKPILIGPCWAGAGSAQEEGGDEDEREHDELDHPPDRVRMVGDDYLLEDGVVRPIDQRVGAFGRERLREVLRAVDVVLPHLARQLVEDLDAVPVGIRDVHAMGHAVIDAPEELHALRTGETRPA